jgi:cell division protein FtsX
LSVVAASGWIPAYSANLAGYCWRCWRARALVWLGTVVAVGAILALAANAELFVFLAQRGLSAQMQSTSEFQVFLADGAQPGQVQGLQAKIGALPGVRGVAYRSKAEALSLARHDSTLAGMAESASANPFPASLVVQLDDPSAAGQVTAVASGDAATDHDVPSSYTPSQGRRLSAFLSAAQAVVVGVAILALAVTSLVALVLLRSEIRVRRAELRILALVGTPRPVIRLPVLLEAVALAAAGSLLAAVSLSYLGDHVVPAVNGYLPFLQLGSAAGAVQAISLATVVSSVVALGGCSLLVRLPR